MKLKANNGQAYNYQPGDHVAIYPSNKEDMVDKLLQVVTECGDFDQVLRIQRKEVDEESET